MIMPAVTHPFSYFFVCVCVYVLDVCVCVNAAHKDINDSLTSESEISSVCICIVSKGHKYTCSPKSIPNTYNISIGQLSGRHMFLLLHGISGMTKEYILTAHTGLLV